MAPPVVVVGAGGRTGRECVAALEAAGTPVRAVVRDPAKHAGSLGSRPGVELVAGDVSSGDVPSLRAALKGGGGVIFAASGSGFWSAKAVDCEARCARLPAHLKDLRALAGVGHVAQAAKEEGGQQVVLVSSCLVSPHNRFNPIRILLNNLRWSLMDYKFKGEELLKRSGVPYTIVRPGGLSSEPAGQAVLVAAQGDRTSGRTSRADVAAVCVAALKDPAARNVTLEVVGKSPEGGAAVPPLQQQLAGLFAGLKKDA